MPIRPEPTADAQAALAALADLPGVGGDTAHMRVRLASLGDGRAHLRVATAGPVVELSELLPIVESLGLWVVDEDHTGSATVGLHRLTVRRRDDAPLDIDADAARLADALIALWDGLADIGLLNWLVTSAGLTWVEVARLRAYRHYRHQVDNRYDERYADQVLVDHPAIARLISQLFAARFGPGTLPDQDRASALSAQISTACDAVSRLDHDRILRGIAATVDATLRTNAGLRPDGPLALKLDPAAIPDMPQPVPYREIFVFGPGVAGVHLRAAPVARGGIRFSDRPEDYRAEVLDLMRTQVLKNSLIVPTGAKGGFVLRGTAPAAADRPGAIQAGYEAFVSGLLDVTLDDDDAGAGDADREGVGDADRERVGDADRPASGPGSVDDPYLVVAADKGTASFSDVANRIAVERGFWLGDAFASGGSSGYDHRALGITARGAWVAVQRHFRSLYIDVDHDPFTVVGVGDMSGDVFGNGMLQTNRIRLLAAFDHRDIFLDPDPDPAASFAERRRLQALASSSWAQYDPAHISVGGGVFPRTAKRIDLSGQVRDALRIEAESFTPVELVSAILRAPVDLLYLGGIGTYVRASTEADSELDDRSNADVRVVARDLRARVVGEGANLGFTQRARIEYARRGGHINTDAIDNSAGVDTSDHEVNIKILLASAIDAGVLAPADRDATLADATDEVVAAVLADSADQSDALGRAQTASADAIDALAATQADLVAAGVLDPVLECLPGPADYDARRQAGAGLTRPELAVLLAGAKRQLKAAVLASDLPDDPLAAQAAVSYFPPSLSARFASLVARHRLRRELVASEVANDLVDHLGLTAGYEMAAASGLGLADVAAAYWVARGVSRSQELWALVGRRRLGVVELGTSLDPIDPGASLVELLRSLTRQELRIRTQLVGSGRPHDLTARVSQDMPVFALLSDLAVAPIGAGGLVPSQAARRLAERLAGSGFDADVAARLACLPDLAVTPDIAGLERQSGRPADEVIAVFNAISAQLGIDRLLPAVAAAGADDGWSRALRHGMLDDLEEARRTAAAHALRFAPAEPRSAAESWLDGRSAQVELAVGLVARVLADPAAGLEGLAVAVRAVLQVVAEDDRSAGLAAGTDAQARH